MRLLVIDDDVGMRTLVKEVAEGMGMLAEAVGDPAFLSPDHFQAVDLIILDLVMPGLDGIEVLRTLAGSSAARVILTSGMGERVLRSASQIAGTHGVSVAGILGKPFRVQQLKDVLTAATAIPKADQAVARRLTCHVSAGELARAIANRELVVHFQPKVSLKDDAWLGVEALLRWQHPEHGLLYPDAFISHVEGPAWALPVTEAVLRSSIAQVKLLQEKVGFDGSLSVNLPAAAMSDISLTNRLLGWVDEFEFDHKRLMLEITETSIPKDGDVALDIATRLRMNGVGLSIDDFGTGYSSLERLDGAPFDELKIDMMFVRRAESDRGAGAIIENATRLAHDLGLVVVAEGVETVESYERLRNFGCDVVQGYFISRPLPVEQLCGWAAARERRATGGLPAATG